MTFAALAKTFNRFTSSSSSSSVASSSGSLRRSKLFSTSIPSTEVKSQAGEIRQEEEKGEKENIGQVMEKEEPAGPTAEAIEEMEHMETHVTPILASKSAVEPEEQTEDTGEKSQEANANVDDEGEDMDIASSRGSTPEPIIVSRESLNSVSADASPQTPQDPTTPPLVKVENSGHIGRTSLENRPHVDAEVKAADHILPVLNRKMSEAELDQAKCLVLDLLGWGVSPEYLLERGISHALIYTAFLDLRLRLPENVMNECRHLAGVCQS